MKYKIAVESNVLAILKQLFPKSSNTAIKQMLKEERIQVDGKLIKSPTKLLVPGQTLTVGAKVKHADLDLKILYQDEDIIIIDKPSGLLSVASNYEKGETAEAILKTYFYPRTIYKVHRLDQETSGVMAFAFSQKGREALIDLFAKHDLLRQYIAIVEGHPTQKKGTWKSYLYEDANYKVHVTDNPMIGQLAITHYSVEGRSKRYTKLRLTLETGRKNQIRVHCQIAGYPVIGDKKYGGLSNPLKRLGLHAEVLEFVHPFLKKSMRFYSPAPEEFEKMMKKVAE